MKKKNVNRTLLHLLFFFAVGIWLIAVLVRAARTEGDQILYSEGIADQEMYECKHKMKAERK